MTKDLCFLLTDVSYTKRFFSITGFHFFFYRVFRRKISKRTGCHSSATRPQNTWTRRKSRKFVFAISLSIKTAKRSPCPSSASNTSTSIRPKRPSQLTTESLILSSSCFLVSILAVYYFLSFEILKN